MNGRPAAGAIRHVLYVTTERWVDFTKPEGVPVHLDNRRRAMESLGIRMSWARYQRRLPEPGGGTLAEAWAKYREVSSRRADTREVAKLAAVLAPDADIVHEWYSLYGEAGLALARRHRKPLVFEVDALLIEEYTGLHGLKLGRLRLSAARACLRANLKAAAQIVVRSQVMADVLQGEWGAPARKITVIPCALNLAKFNAAPKPPVRQPPVVVFLGSLQPWHGCEILLEAFARLRAEGSPALLSIVGDGKQRASLSAQTARLGLERAVTFHGSVPHSEMPAHLLSATVAVAPYPELPVPFYFSPIKIFEYMGAGVAIAASRIGQIGDVLADDESALLVPPGDAAALARAMRRLLADAPLRARLAARARALAENYTYERQAHTLLGVYRKALEARG